MKISIHYSLAFIMIALLSFRSFEKGIKKFMCLLKEKIPMTDQSVDPLHRLKQHSRQ